MQQIISRLGDTTFTVFKNDGDFYSQYIEYEGVFGSRTVRLSGQLSDYIESYGTDYASLITSKETTIFQCECNGENRLISIRLSNSISLMFGNEHGGTYTYFTPLYIGDDDTVIKHFYLGFSIDDTEYYRSTYRAIVEYESKGTNYLQIVDYFTTLVYELVRDCEGKLPVSQIPCAINYGDIRGKEKTFKMLKTKHESSFNDSDFDYDSEDGMILTMQAMINYGDPRYYEGFEDAIDLMALDYGESNEFVFDTSLDDEFTIECFVNDDYYGARFLASNDDRYGNHSFSVRGSKEMGASHIYVKCTKNEDERVVELSPVYVIEKQTFVNLLSQMGLSEDSFTFLSDNVILDLGSGDAKGRHVWVGLSKFTNIPYVPSSTSLNDDTNGGGSSSNPSNTEEEEPNDPVNDDYFFEPIEDVADLRDTFWQDGHHKDLIITDGVVTVVNGALSVGTHEVYITNSELHSESFQLDEAICQDEDLNFGEASASCIHFKFSGDIIALKGKQLRVYMYLDNNPNTLFQLGIYKVESDIPTADRLSRDVTAYDALYDVVSADVASWYKGISFPVTLRAFFTSFMNKFGIAIDNNADLINANMVVRRTVDPDTLSGKDVLTACLQAFGCFGRIGRNGHFQFVYLRRGIRGLYPRVDLYPKDTLYPREALGVAIGKSYYIPPCQYEDYLVSEIDKLEIRDDDNSIGTTVGSGNNAFVVSGNFLFYGMSETDRLVYATAIYNRITGIVYRPYSTDMLGNPSIQCGDVIRLNTSYTTVEAYVLKRSLKGIQALRDTISADGQQTRSDNVNSLSTRLKNVETKTTAEIKTLSDSLGLYVTKEGVVGDLNSKMSSSIVIQPEKIEITSDGSLIITTSQFKLDANGNATFGGTVSGGKLTQTDSSNGKVEIQNGVITSSNTASSQTATINNANVTITNSSTGHSTSLNAGGITIMNGSTIALNITPSQAKINGYNIITTKNIGSQSVSYASTANSASYLSSRLDTYDGLSANVDGAATDEALINIGSVYKAVTPRYFNHHEANTGSDRKLKTDIKEMDKRYLDLLDLLKVKNFRFKSDLDNVRCGLIAQEVESALADLNIEDSNLVISNNYDTETYLGVNYVQLLTILIPAYQQLKKQHETLVNALKEKGVIE